MSDLNHRLATLTGWSNLFDAGGALMGTPPHGAPNSRGQELVPDWTGDWRACGLLSSKHQISVEHSDVMVRAWVRHRSTAIAIGPFGDRDATARRAIVTRVIAELERAQ